MKKNVKTLKTLCLSIPALLLFMGTGSLMTAHPVEPQETSSEIVLRKTCVDAECHPKLKEYKYTHSPVLLDACNQCHKISEENRHIFEVSDTDQKLCVFCHKLKLKKFTHEPVTKGECSKCHDPHGSDFPFMLNSDPSKTLCLTCHTVKEETILANEYTHAPAAQGACILCHRGHSSENENLVIGQGNELCLFCHEKEFEPLLRERHVHKPVAENCQECHDPHGSDNPMLLQKDEPEFCFECHENIADILKNSSNVHAATCIEKNCSNCHSPHASSLPRLLKKPMLAGCLSCHDKSIEGRDGKMLLNIAELMIENPFKHGPIQQNNCVACHNPHAADVSRLLVSYFPEEFYIPFNVDEYNLCFQCHTKATFLEERTTALTNFRDGDQNLHFLHVNKEEKGRTCRACHAIHASKQQAHVRSSVPYGNWEFQVVFKGNADGGTCSAGCHKEKSYSRKYKKIKPLLKSP